MSSDLCFVVEDQDGVCGYALAALDTIDLQQKCNMAWIPAMCDKYPKPNKTDLSPSEARVLQYLFISLISYLDHIQYKSRPNDTETNGFI